MKTAESFVLCCDTFLFFKLIESPEILSCLDFPLIPILFPAAFVPCISIVRRRPFLNCRAFLYIFLRPVSLQFDCISLFVSPLFSAFSINIISPLLSVTPLTSLTAGA